MARNYAGASEEQAEPVDWLALFYVGCAVFLAGMDWWRVKTLISGVHSRPAIFTGLSGLVVLNVLLTVFLERSLGYALLPREWRYRLSFLISAGLALAYFTILLLLTAHLRGYGWLWSCGLVSALSGAFLGSLTTTIRQEGLWEDNLPPSDPISMEVQRYHQQWIWAPLRMPAGKRAFDICLSALGLLLSAPIWVLSIFLVWFDDPGPVLFVKNSVGLGGVNFRQFKFRTMIWGAETHTGPVLAQVEDDRILFAGRILRKTALDELPQLINILKGEMSFVGPRPQRTVLVHDYLHLMPEYADRHRVRPGLAGLAQVAGDYYLTPRQKLRFDRLYIRYMGFAFDFKLLLLAGAITFWFRWQRGWDGRLPRSLLRFGDRSGRP